MAFPARGECAELDFRDEESPLTLQRVLDLQEEAGGGYARVTVSQEQMCEVIWRVALQCRYPERDFLGRPMRFNGLEFHTEWMGKM